MISILMDFVPDEVHKEISMKYETVGKRASNLKTIQLMTEKVIQREKDRLESRKDRKNTGRVAAVGEKEDYHCPSHSHDSGQGHDKQEMYVWGQQVNAGYGGFVAAAVKRGRDDEDEAKEESDTVPKRKRQEDEGSKGKSKGKGKADRECFLCGERPLQGPMPQPMVCP